MDNQFLQRLGFSEKQAGVYLALLKLGEGTIQQIAKAARIKRPTTYLIIDQLEAEGFVARQQKGKSEVIRGLSPYTVLDRRRSAVEDFAARIPELLTLNQKHSASPRVTILTGVRGVEQSMQDRLGAKTELLFWADNNLQFTHKGLASSVQRDYMRERIKQKIWTRGIIPYEQNRAILKRENLEAVQKFYLELKKTGTPNYREFVFVSRGEFSRQVEMWVFDSKVDFFSSTDFIGARIEHAGFAETMRSVFLSQFRDAKAKEDAVLSDDDSEYLMS